MTTKMTDIILEGVVKYAFLHTPLKSKQGYSPCYLLTLVIPKDKAPDGVKIVDEEDGLVSVKAKVNVMSKAGKPNKAPVVVDKDSILTDKEVYSGSKVRAKTTAIETATGTFLFLKAVKVLEFADAPDGSGVEDEFTPKNDNLNDDINF